MVLSLKTEVILWCSLQSSVSFQVCGGVLLLLGGFCGFVLFCFVVCLAYLGKFKQCGVSEEERDGFLCSQASPLV